MGNEKRAELELVERQLPLRDLALPEPAAVDLWLIDLAALGSPLQPGERIDRTRFPTTQRRTLRRFYLRLLLGAYLGLPGKDVHLVRHERGKPVLDHAAHGESLEFSMAASSGYCLVGVTSGSVVGVDLEPRGRRARNPLALARRYFSEAEYQELEVIGKEGNGPLDDAFLHTWACKEAVVKAGGTGIANALCRFTVDVRPDRPASVLAMDDDEATAWQLRAFDLPGGLFGAVTVRCPTLELGGFRLLSPT
jgi:4'-phosphopantetheinyl transferase